MTKFSVIERSFRFKTPFVISGHVFKTSDVVQVTVKEDGFIGHGEASGVYFTGETTATIKAQIEAYLGNAANPLSFDRLNAELPSGGARNALDCALWDLECKRRNTRIWDLVNVNVRELQTVMTVGLDSPDNMGRAAAKAGPAKILKLKLGPDDPIGCTRVVREQRPDVDLIVDINQGWSETELQSYAPELQKLGVSMIEQPLPRGKDEALVDYQSPVPLAADETCLDMDELNDLKGYDIVNIKLDKSGGLTEALKMIDLAHKTGRDVMIGNMAGSSLAMAPAFIVGLSSTLIDLDGPLLLSEDVENGLEISASGIISPPGQQLWG